MVYLIKLSIIFVSLLFVSCSSKQEVQISSIPIPNWYLQPPSNDQAYLYGSASAFTIEEAKAIALDQISKQLVVKVNSKFSSSTTSATNYYEKRSTQNLEQKSLTIEFSNYKIVKSQKIDDTFYILLKVDRIKLFNNYKNKFNTIHNKITYSLKKINNKNRLVQIFTLKDELKSIKKAKVLLNILVSIDNSFDDKKYLDVYNKIQNNISKLQSNIRIAIKSNDTISKNQFSNFLNSNSYNISNKNSDITIKLNTTSLYSKAYGWYVAKKTTNIKIISNNKLLLSHTINYKGRSSTSEQSANLNSGTNFYKKLKDLGIEKILFNR